MKIVWDDHALAAWHRLSIKDATALDLAAQLWASHGAGMVRVSDGGTFPLFVGVLVVEFYLDDSTATICVSARGEHSGLVAKRST